MARVNVVEMVTEWVEEIVKDSDLELVDVEYVKEHTDWILRVFIDKPGGIDLEDCQKVSGVLDKKLDEADPIAAAYSLEVSSPGLERPLKKAADYVRFAGRQVHIRTYSGIYGQKRFEGTLEGLENDNVLLKWEGETIEIPLELVSKANLALEL
ncbi:MAG TPA: ribosome maturation factor RimP [Limnochordia bacterium]|nr:ribosome maturation factor RimP [Limnochordia bacterium]